MPSFAPQRRAAAAVLLGLAVVTCTRDLDAPRIPARIELAPRFVTGATPPGNALAVDQVRAQVVRHSTAEVVVDKTYPFTSGTSLQLSISFSLTQPTDTFDVFLDYERGTEILFSGSQSVVVTGGVTPAPVPLPVGYVGPGKGATSMTIGPRDTVLTSGDPLQLRLTVLDTATPDSLYVGWGTNSGSVAVDPAGRLVASITRGTVTVRATSPTPPGLSDSTTVRIVPKPAAMVKVSGDGQTGVASQPLPLPLVVQVNGSDNLGVPGVTVTFAALSGGAVDSAQVVTDSLGRASTGVTLGPSTAAQSFSATAGALSVTFGATGSAAPPKTWTGAVSSDWGTAGNWNPAGVPTATDSVIVPPGTANSAVIRATAYSVAGLSIQSGAIVTMDTASLLVNGSFTQAGTFTDPSVSSALSLNGTGKTLAGSIPILATTVIGTYAVTGNVLASTLQVTGGLTLGGHTLTTTGAFGTAGTGVITMTNAADSLVVQGTAAFAGGVETGHLTAGTFVLAGNFAVTVHSGFDAGPSHLTVFNGSATQSVAVFDTTHSNQFGSVEFRNKVGVVFDQLTGVNGNARLDTSAVVTSTDTTYVGGGMALNGGLTTFPASLLRVGELWVNTTFNAGGTYAVTATIFTGNGQTVPTGVTFPFLYCNGANVSVGSGVTVGTQFAVQAGTTTLSGDFSVPANTFIQFTGKLVLNGHAFSTGGDLSITQSALLQMTNAADSLYVFGNAFFEGGNESGLMTAGLSLFFNNFTEGSGDPQAYAPSGSHIDVFVGGGTQTISFGHPGGAGASHFQGFAVDNPQGALHIASDVYLMGGYAYVAGVPKIVHGSGQVVHYASLNVTGVTFDNVAIAYDAALGGNNLIALDSVTFENYNVNSATPLIDITSPGNTASPGTFFLFNNMTFNTDITGAGGSGTYLRVTDSNAGDGNVLTIDINSGLVVTEGMAHTILAGGAVVNWAQP